MFLVANAKLKTNPLGEGSSTDRDPEDEAAPSFQDMRTMPSEHRALLQEQFWGGVERTNFVIFINLYKFYILKKCSTP